MAISYPYQGRSQGSEQTVTLAALSHLVNPLTGGSSRQLLQDFVGRTNRAAKRGRFWSPSYFARSCGGTSPSTVKNYITNQRRPD
jgi:putative transposase